VNRQSDRTESDKLSIDGEKVTSRATALLPADARPQATNSSPAQRLHSESNTLFVLGFDLTRAPAPLVRLDFSFDRVTLLARVREGVCLIKRSIIGFSGFGAVSILLGCGYNGNRDARDPQNGGAFSGNLSARLDDGNGRSAGA
jgi:hypothetical protein